MIIRDDVVSVPSRGTTFPNQQLRPQECAPVPVSVPSRGNTFPNCGYKDYVVGERYGFRPLSGNYISKCAKFTIGDVHKIVSVPSRGTTFPNHITA